MFKRIKLYNELGKKIDDDLHSSLYCGLLRDYNKFFYELEREILVCFKEEQKEIYVLLDNELNLKL